MRFAHASSTVELDTLTEGAFVDGEWMPARILIGDERYFMFPQGALRVVRIQLLRRNVDR